MLEEIANKEIQSDLIKVFRDESYFNTFCQNVSNYIDEYGTTNFINEIRFQYAVHIAIKNQRRK